MPKRKAIRLKNYLYSQNGAYFITICSFNRKQIFGRIEGTVGNAFAEGKELCSCRLSEIGRIIDDEIDELPKRYPFLSVDKYIIMPNHIHLILRIERQEQSPCPTIGDIICTLKSITTKTANQSEQLFGRKIWQFRFHDHVIRNEQKYQFIWNYIDTNPMRWAEDCFYVDD